MISVESMKLLRELLGGASIQVEAPDFEETSRKLAKAKRELDQSLARLEPKKPKAKPPRRRKK